MNFSFIYLFVSETFLMSYFLSHQNNEDEDVKVYLYLIHKFKYWKWTEFICQFVIYHDDPLETSWHEIKSKVIKCKVNNLLIKNSVALIRSVWSLLLNCIHQLNWRKNFRIKIISVDILYLRQCGQQLRASVRILRIVTAKRFQWFSWSSVN